MLRLIERETIILNAGDFEKFHNCWMRRIMLGFKLLDAGIMCGFTIVGCEGLCQVFETRYRCFYAKHNKCGAKITILVYCGVLE
jgi:hypothetical protein